MKFNVTINKDLVNSNGKVSVTDAKKVAEDAAKVAYDFGKATGLLYGGLLMVAVPVAVEVVSAFFKKGKNNER